MKAGGSCVFHVLPSHWPFVHLQRHAEACVVSLNVCLSLSIAAASVSGILWADTVGVLFGGLGTLLGPGTGALDLAVKAGSHLLRSRQIPFSLFSWALSHSQRNCSPKLDFGLVYGSEMEA